MRLYLDGISGCTIQDWLIAHGLETAKTRNYPAAANGNAPANGSGPNPITNNGHATDAAAAKKRASNANNLRRDLPPGAESAAATLAALGSAPGFVKTEDVKADSWVPIPVGTSSMAAAAAVAGVEGSAGRGNTVLGVMSHGSLRIHRPGCMCVICKQGRRSAGGGDAGGTAYGMGPTGAAAAAAAAWEASGGGMGAGRDRCVGGRVSNLPVKPLGPGMRTGKRAFVQATPHLPRGPAQHK